MFYRVMLKSVLMIHIYVNLIIDVISSSQIFVEPSLYLNRIQYLS